MMILIEIMKTGDLRNHILDIKTKRQFSVNLLYITTVTIECIVLSASYLYLWPHITAMAEKAKKNGPRIFRFFFNLNFLTFFIYLFIYLF